MGTQIYVQIYCDKCGCVGDNAHWGRTKELKKELKSDGWKTVNGKLVCADCLKKVRVNDQNRVD